MRNELFTKIYGSLAGIAIGDALGFPVHDMAKEEIQVRYGGLVDRMLPAFEDDFIHIGYKAGQVTDDTILSFSYPRRSFSKPMGILLLMMW